MIGVYDSGYGGLTVLKSLVKNLPEYDYLYFGDNARAPYGSKSEETIIKYSEKAVEYLFDQGAQLIITACNTVSSLSLRHLQNKYIVDAGLKNKNILGVIIPVAEKAIKETKNERISVVGTEGTINSKKFDAELNKLNKNIEVSSESCPLLVPYIEEHLHNNPEIDIVLEKYLKTLKSEKSDILILGCTHYPLIQNKFKKIMGDNVKVLDGAEIIAESLKDYLQRHPEIEGNLQKNGKIRYLTTDCPDKFKEFGNSDLGLNIKEVKKVTIW